MEAHAVESVVFVGNTTAEDLSVVDGLCRARCVTMSYSRDLGGVERPTRVLGVLGPTGLPNRTGRGDSASECEVVVARWGAQECGRAVADALGCRLEIAPSADVAAVAEHTVLLLLALAHRLDDARRALLAEAQSPRQEPRLTSQRVHRFNWVGLSGARPLFGARIGVVGLGAIGGAVARILVGLGADVGYTKRTRLAESEERKLKLRHFGLDDLLKWAEFLTVHTRFDEEHGTLLGAREFSLMPPGAVLVNTARGRLIDEEALAESLESKHLAGAGLDVYEWEPIRPDSRLLRCSNVVLTPHVAGIPPDQARTLEILRCAQLAIEMAVDRPQVGV